jgi:hypothetical protein
LADAQSKDGNRFAVAKVESRLLASQLARVQRNLGRWGTHPYPRRWKSRVRRLG